MLILNRQVGFHLIKVTQFITQHAYVPLKNNWAQPKNEKQNSICRSEEKHRSLV